MTDLLEDIANLLRELGPVLFAGLVPFVIFGLIIAGAASNLIAWQPPILQTTQFGTVSSENGITSIGSSATSTYAAGFVGYQIPNDVFNATPAYLFLNKYDLGGNEIWSRHFDKPYHSIVTGLSVEARGVYIVGLSNLTSFLKEYDTDGNLLMSMQFGNWSAISVSASPTNIYLGGDNATVAVGNASVLKDYTANGTLVWSSVFGASSKEDMEVQYGAGGIYAVYPGSFQKFDLTGNLAWKRYCPCDGPRITVDSTNVYLAGRQQAPPFGGFLSKYDSGGTQLWSATFNAPGFAGLERVDASADNSGVFVSATYGSPPGASIMKYDANGNQVWSFQLPWITGLGLLTPRDVVTNQADMIYLGGDLSTRSADNQAFVSSISKSSSLIFFGVNPPFSFLLLSVLIVATVLSAFLFRRRWVRIRRTRPPDLSRTARFPTDISSRPS